MFNLQLRFYFSLKLTSLCVSARGEVIFFFKKNFYILFLLVFYKQKYKKAMLRSTELELTRYRKIQQGLKKR